MNFFRGGVAPNDGAPKACPNPFTGTSGSGSGGSNKNENDQRQPPTQPPTQQTSPPATFLPEIETREDEELCPSASASASASFSSNNKNGGGGADDGGGLVKNHHIPLCCYSQKNLESKSYVYKFMCYRR